MWTQVVKTLLPAGVLHSLRRFRTRRRMKRFAHVPIGRAFDDIYRRGLWGDRAEQASGGGSYGEVADRYTDLVHELIAANRVTSIVDIGCGDFSIGARLAPRVARYVALDVSGEIIAVNTARYAHLSNVEFGVLDACSGPIPAADLVTVRQVLQHLTNRQIEAILRNLESSGAKFALIAEHVVRVDKMGIANLDLPSHGSDTRVALGSGVLVDFPPFSRPARRVASIPIPTDSIAGTQPDQSLDVFLWELGR